jgi:hypothetical protein
MRSWPSPEIESGTALNGHAGLSMALHRKKQENGEKGTEFHTGLAENRVENTPFPSGDSAF